jgi:uncharacterized membrane protein
MAANKVTLNRSFPYIIGIAALIGLVASLILSYDTLSIARNPSYIPSCNLNPVISCGSVINATGDTIFGIPYPYYGIGAFAAMLSVAVMMFAGAKPNKYFWRAFMVIISAGLIGAYVLLGKSVFSIHALCPFCLSVDLVTTVSFWYSWLYVIDNKIISFERVKLQRIYGWIRKHHADLIVLWILLVVGFLLNHFWYYYGKHL